VITDLRRTVPEAKILVFTAYDTDDLVLGALQAGATGYLLKGATAEEIARAICIVDAGGSYLEPRVARKVVNAMAAPPRPAVGLSERELQVLRHVTDGLASKQIAHILGISERTVKFHLQSIFNKLGAENRAQAVALAVQKGLL
jgi:DNA-binding NarL/FixJ family response regulator